MFNDINNLSRIIILNLNTHYYSIVGYSLAFIGSILTIYVTLVTISIQNVLGKYSFDLVKKVIKNKIFAICLTSFLAIFIYNIFLLALNQNDYLIIIDFGLFILSSLILILLICHTYYLLDVRNQVSDICKVITKNLEKRIVKDDLKNVNALSDTLPKLPADTLDVISKLEVSTKITDQLKIQSEPIINIIHTAIQDNRYELVSSALRSFLKVVQCYFDCRKDFKTGEDAFLSYLFDKTTEMKNLVQNNTHPAIMDMIADFCGDVAISTLPTKTLEKGMGDNALPYGFIIILKDIVISKEAKKDTSYACMTACSKLGEIGKLSIKHNCPTVINVVADALSEIAIIMTKARYTYGDYLAARANAEILEIANEAVVELDSIQVNRERLINKLFKNISKNIESYLASDPSVWRHNLKTIYGVMAKNSIQAIFNRGLQKHFSNPNNFLQILNNLSKFIRELWSLDKSKEATAETIEGIGSQLYTICLLLNEYTISVKDQYGLDILFKVIDEILEFIYSIVDRDYENGLCETENEFVSLIGHLYTRRYKHKKMVDKLIDKWIEKYLTDLTKLKGNDYREKRRLRYLRLIGSWVYHWNLSSSISEKIKTTLANSSSLFSIDINALVPDEDYIYPQGLLSGRGWIFARPSAMYLNTIFLQKMDKKLFDTKILDKYESFLSTQVVKN